MSVKDRFSVLCIFSPMAQKSLLGQGLLINEDSQSHSRHTTLGGIPPDKWSARRRELYLTTHNAPKWQTVKPPAGYEPAITAGEKPQPNSLDLACM